MLYVRCSSPAAGGIDGKVPEALRGFFAFDADQGRWRLLLDLVAREAHAVALVVSFISWRESHEAVFALGSHLHVEQFVGLASSLLRAEDLDRSELERLGGGQTYTWDQGLQLFSQLRSATLLFDEVATPGWSIVDSLGVARRRDFSVFQEHLLAEIGTWSVILSPQEGYVAVCDDETGTCTNTREVLERFDVGLGCFVTRTGVAFDCHGEVGTLFESLVGVTDTGMRVVRIPALLVFARAISSLAGALEYLAERPGWSLTIFRSGGLELLYPESVEEHS